MDSQNSVDEVLQLIESLSRKDLQEKINDLLPVLTSSLSVEDENFRSIKIVHVLLNTCLPLVTIHNADKQIFRYALPVLEQLFLESVNGIRFKFGLEEIVDQSELIDHVEGLLKVCHLLLESVECGLNYVQSSEKVFINEIPSLPKHIGLILCEAFKHCRESEKLYGELFQYLSEDLSMMFKKSHSIQGQYLATLSDNIVINCSHEEDVILLVEVLEILEEIGEVVTALDVKTMAKQWKSYVKFIQENSEHLRQRIDIARPVRYLSSEIVNGLKNVLEMDPADTKNITKNLKLLNFLLKLVMIICELFIGNLGNCPNDILQLMLSVLGLSQPYLQLKKIPSKLIEEIESHVVIGIEPLLSRLISGAEFPEVYFEFVTTLSFKHSLKLGYLLLTNFIFKNLAQSEEGTQSEWLSRDPDHNIVHTFLKSLNYCHVELTLDLRVRGSCRGPEGEVVESTQGLYESLLIHLSAFLTTISCKTIKIVEKILLENILAGRNIWCVLMTADVWCMISRCGSAEFCFQQVNNLSRFFRKMSSDCNFPVTSYLRMLLHRLFSLLSIKDIVKMVNIYPPVSNPKLWFVFGLSKLPVQLKCKIQEELLHHAAESIENYLSSPPSINRFLAMRDSLCGSCTALKSLCKEGKRSEALKLFIPSLTELWTCIPQHNSSLNNLWSLNWFNIFLNYLSSATCLISNELNNCQILKILQILKSNIRCNYYSVKISAINILKSLADKFFTCDSLQAQIFSEIASLFCLLLKDDNILIQQMSLETFSYFSHRTHHEKIIGLSVGVCEEVDGLVRNYLKKIPSQSTSNEKLSFAELLVNQPQGKIIHNCVFTQKKLEIPFNVKLDEKTEIFSESTICKGSENTVETQKRKSEEDLSVVVKRMKEDILFLTEAYSQNVLPPDIHNEVQRMANRLINMN